MLVAGGILSVTWALMRQFQLVLASQSPRRRELLTTAGFQFTVRAVAVEETRAPGEAPEHYALRLAREKAEASWQAGPRSAGEVVLGADTIVVLGDIVLEKPDGTARARSMLQQLSGREHRVITGVCLRHAGGAEVASESTLVKFAKLSAEEIAEYAASEEPIDKAGAYAIQGLASKFVERIEGCFFNVVGLPLALVYRKLKDVEADLSSGT
jgi:septum formation protein